EPHRRCRDMNPRTLPSGTMPTADSSIFFVRGIDGSRIAGSFAHCCSYRRQLFKNIGSKAPCHFGDAVSFVSFSARGRAMNARNLKRGGQAHVFEDEK